MRDLPGEPGERVGPAGRAVSCPCGRGPALDPSARLSARVLPVGLGSWEPPVREPLAGRPASVVPEFSQNSCSALADVSPDAPALLIPSYFEKLS